MSDIIHKDDITVVGETNFRGMRRKFGIKRDDRRRHMYLVGKTGMGKSTTIENMIISDIEAGRGVALVDPHGDLAEKVIRYIPSHRINDVVYFNPADTKFPVAFNILEDIGEDYKHLVAYGLVGVFKKIWADSWGPRMEYILTNTILALLDYPGSSLMGVMRLLVDKSYRKKVVSKVKDPVVKTFWTDEFANYSEKFRTEAIAPIQNKVGQFLSSSIIRNIVGQSKSTIEIRELMDQEKILIMNLSKGRVGEESSALLGAMMITKIQIAAMSRVDIPEEERKDFYLYVDEFQNFATDSFAGILSEARKYRLNLIMAHQYIEQLSDEVKAAVFGNVGTMLIYRVGAADAADLEPEFEPQFTAQDIVNVSKYNYIIRLMIDGIATVPFSAIGLAPSGEPTGNEDKVIKVSRERYGRPRDIVEDKIIRWSGVEIESHSKPKDSEDDSEKDDSDIEEIDENASVELDTQDAAAEAEDNLNENANETKKTKYIDSDAVNSVDIRALDGQTQQPNQAPAIEDAPQNDVVDESAAPVLEVTEESSNVTLEEVSDATDLPTRPRINFVRPTKPEQPEEATEQLVHQEVLPEVAVDSPAVVQDAKREVDAPALEEEQVDESSEVSLKDLKQGVAPTVAVEKNQVAEEVASEDDEPKPKKKKRKRKRKKKSGAASSNTSNNS